MMITDMQKPKSTRDVTKPYSWGALDGNSRIRKQSRRTKVSDACRRQRRKSKTTSVLGIDGGQGSDVPDSLGSMVVDISDVPDIVIHPPSDDGDVWMDGKDDDVETLCAVMEAHLGGVFETRPLKDCQTRP